MATLTFPRGPKDVTASWLTDALRSSGVLADGAVLGVEVTVLGEGKGFTGQVARIEIDYIQDDDALPPSLIAKFPPASPEMFEVLNRYGLYEKEAGFYNTASALITKDRKTSELDVMRAYYEKLVACGVTHYTFEDCLHGYKLATLDLYYFMVTVLVILDFTVNEEAVAVRDLVFERWGNFVMDHYPIDLLPRA